jgi:hypothetical protein
MVKMRSAPRTDVRNEQAVFMGRASSITSDGFLAEVADVTEVAEVPDLKNGAPEPTKKTEKTDRFSFQVSVARPIESDQNRAKRGPADPSREPSVKLR